MPQTDRKSERTAAARITLIVLGALWIALAVWVWRNQERLLGAAPDVAVGDPGPSVIATGTLPSRSPAPGAVVGTDESRADGASTGDSVEALAAELDTVPVEVRGERSSAQPMSGSSVSVDPAAVESGAEPAAAVPGPGESMSPPGKSAGAPAALAAPSPADDEAGAPMPDAAPPESPFETRRREALATLPELATELRFGPADAAVGTSLREPLERLFEILFLYPGIAVEILVEGNELGGENLNRRLSRERGETIIDYLVSRGLVRARFDLEIGDGRGLPSGEHRVRVRAEADER